MHNKYNTHTHTHTHMRSRTHAQIQTRARARIHTYITNFTHAHMKHTKVTRITQHKTVTQLYLHTYIKHV